MDSSSEVRSVYSKSSFASSRRSLRNMRMSVERLSDKLSDRVVDRMVKMVEEKKGRIEEGIL